jgi:Domain of unknown function (DUF6285)
VRDLPSGRDLLHLARELLMGELLPSLPPQRRLEARLVAAAMAIAEREAEGRDSSAGALASAIARFYGLPPEGGVGCADVLFRRFAADLRKGAFEDSRAPDARAILWRLTLSKLRVGNPSFLAANGFGSGSACGERG